MEIGKNGMEIAKNLTAQVPIFTTSESFWKNDTTGDAKRYSKNEKII